MRISMKQVRNHPEFNSLPNEIKNLTNSAQIKWHLDSGEYDFPACVECKLSLTKWDHTLKSYRQFCSFKCSSVSEQTNNKRKEAWERAGGHPMTLDQSLKKRRNTLKKKFGENYAEDILKKTRASMLKKYGAEHAHQIPALQEKARSTMMEKYGVEYAMQSDHLKEKHTQSVLGSHGVPSPLMSDSVRQQRKETMISRYGTEHALQNSELIRKIKETNQKKFGRPFHSQKNISDFALAILQDQNALKEHLIEFSLTALAQHLGVDPTTVSNYVFRHGLPYTTNFGISNFENQIEAFLKEHSLEYEKRDRTQIGPYEIDFWLPKHKLGIECNGDYWHSDKYKDSKYHYEKWRLASEKELRLIQISESDYYNKKIQFQNMLLSVVGQQEKGPAARKCIIQKIDGRTARAFLDMYHLQGAVNGDHYGAFHKESLVAVMTIGYTRGLIKNRRRELKRWVTDNQTHPGLFSKTLAFAIEDLKIRSLVSFSMNDWFTGDIYQKSGFEKGKIMRPGYRYLWKGKLMHASNFTKSEIRKKLHESCWLLDAGASEKQVLDELGIPRVWDAGKIEWILTVEERL